PARVLRLRHELVDDGRAADLAEVVEEDRNGLEPVAVPIDHGMVELRANRRRLGILRIGHGSSYWCGSRVIVGASHADGSVLLSPPDAAPEDAECRAQFPVKHWALAGHLPADISSFTQILAAFPTERSCLASCVMRGVGHGGARFRGGSKIIEDIA